MSVIGSIPGPVKGGVDLHEPASVGTLGPVSVDAGVQEHVSIPSSVSVDVPGPVSVDIPGPVSVDIPAGPVNVELPMIEFNGNSGNYDDKIIIIANNNNNNNNRWYDIHSCTGSYRLSHPNISPHRHS